MNQTSPNPNKSGSDATQLSSVSKYFNEVVQYLKNTSSFIMEENVQNSLYRDSFEIFKKQMFQFSPPKTSDVNAYIDTYQLMLKVFFSRLDKFNDIYEKDFFSYPKVKVNVNSGDEILTSKSHQIESILKSGADCLNGHFDAILIWYDDTNIKNTIFTSTDNSNTQSFINNEFDKVKNTLSIYGFAVRLNSIDIPAKQNQSFQLKTTSYLVEKIKSMKDIVKQGSFNFRLDQNFEWLRFFNDISGNKATISHSKEKNFDLTSTWQNRIGFFPKSFYIDRHATSKRLCLIVSSNIFENSENGRDTFKREMFQYIFEDVRFLGSSDIEYSNNSTDPTNITVDFIFKRLRKVSL